MRDIIIKATAVFALAIIGLSFRLLTTEYWIAAAVSFAVAIAWLTAFVSANVRRFVK